MTPVYVSSLSGGHMESVNTLSLSSEDVLASGGDDGYLCLWSANQQSGPIGMKEIDLDTCSCVLFSKENPKKLFTSCGRQLFVWDTRHLTEPTATWDLNKDEINSLDLLESESRLAISDDNGEVLIVDTNNGEVVRTLHKHENICSSVRFRPNRPWQVMSGGMDCRVIVSDWKGSGLGVMIFEMEELVETDYQAGFAINPPMVHTLVCSSSGTHVACGLENSTVEVFNGAGKNLIHVESLYGHTKGVSSLLCVEEDSHLVSGGNDGSLFVWQLTPDGTGCQFNHGQQVNTLEGRRLDNIFVADYTSVIQLVDLVAS